MSLLWSVSQWHKHGTSVGSVSLHAVTAIKPIPVHSYSVMETMEHDIKGYEAR